MSTRRKHIPHTAGQPSGPVTLAALERYATAHGLTPMERLVLAHAADNLTLPEIAARLARGVNTIKSHTRGIVFRTGERNFTAAVIRALRTALEAA